MRHLKHRQSLGVTREHRAAMLSNLAAALIRHGRIETTLVKARTLRPFIEKIITKAKKAAAAPEKKDAIHLRRHALRKSLQVAPHLGIGIFSNAQARAGMAQEQVADSDAHAAAAHPGSDLSGQLMKATPARGDLDLSLTPHPLSSQAPANRPAVGASPDCRQPARSDGR